MAKNSKGDMNVAASIEELLKEAGFTTVTKINDRVIHAKVDDDKAFGKAHAAFLKTVCKHPAYVGCSRIPFATSNDLLVVHVKQVSEQPSTTINQQPSTDQEPRD